MSTDAIACRRVRSTSIAVAAVAVVAAASCSPALEKPERPAAAELVTSPAHGEAGTRTGAADAGEADTAADTAVAGAAVVLGDAGARHDAGQPVELAQGPGACPEWLPSSRRAFASARTKETPAFPRAELGMSEPTCCWVTTTDMLCGKPVSAEHAVGATYGSRILGIRRGVARPWLDAMLEVRAHGSMKYAGALLVRLNVSVAGDVVALSLRDGVCPRPCTGSKWGCQQAEASAMKSCDALGSYRAGDPQKLP